LEAIALEQAVLLNACSRCRDPWGNASLQDPHPLPSGTQETLDTIQPPSLRITSFQALLHTGASPAPRSEHHKASPAPPGDTHPRALVSPEDTSSSSREGDQAWLLQAGGAQGLGAWRPPKGQRERSN